MATYGEMQTNIKTLLSRADLDLLIPQSIKQAIQFYELEPFAFNESLGSVVTTSGTAFYTLTAVLQMIQVKITENGYTRSMTNKTFQEIEETDITNYTTSPVWWALFNDRLRIYPTPDATYTISYAYVVKPATLSASTDSNVWTTTAYNLIENRALWWLHNYKTRNIPLANQYKNGETENYLMLRGSNALNAAGRVRPTQF